MLRSLAPYTHFSEMKPDASEEHFHYHFSGFLSGL